MKFFEKICKSIALPDYHHGLQWKDGIIPHSMVKRLITMAVMRKRKRMMTIRLSYTLKEKREWLADIFDNFNIEILDASYEDRFFYIIYIINIIRCVKHVKNCALQNVFKIYNWSQRQKEIYQI